MRSPTELVAEAEALADKANNFDRWEVSEVDRVRFMLEANLTATLALTSAVVRLEQTIANGFAR